MFTNVVDQVPRAIKPGIVPFLGRLPDRVLIAYRYISASRTAPAIGRTRNGCGSEYYRLRFRRGRNTCQSLYLGMLDDQSHRLLADHIVGRWPDDEKAIRCITARRKELRQKVVELAATLGFRFRGHEIRRRR